MDSSKLIKYLENDDYDSIYGLLKKHAKEPSNAILNGYSDYNSEESFHHSKSVFLQTLYIHERFDLIEKFAKSMDVNIINRQGNNLLLSCLYDIRPVKEIILSIMKYTTNLNIVNHSHKNILHRVVQIGYSYLTTQHNPRKNNKKNNKQNGVSDLLNDIIVIFENLLEHIDLNATKTDAHNQSLVEYILYMDFESKFIINKAYQFSKYIKYCKISNLIYAVHTSNYDMVEFVLNLLVDDINTVYNYQTVLEYANGEKNQDIIDLLIAHGAV